MFQPRGGFNRRIDSSGRVTIPEVLRKDYPFESFVVAPGFDNSIRLYSPKGWASFAAKLRELDPDHPDEGDYLRFYASSACEVEVDAENRVRIPEILLDWAGLRASKERSEGKQPAPEVWVFDMGEYLELWPTEKWREFFTGRSDKLKEIARRLHGRNRGQETEGDQS